MINVLLATAAMSVAFAQSPAPSHTHRPDGIHAIKAAPAAPYASLFKGEPQPERERFTLRPRTQDRRAAGGRHGRHQPEVERGLCGMPIIAADATGDSKMVVEIPREAAGAATMRAVEMKDCNQRR